MIDKLLKCVKKKETDKEIKALEILCPLVEEYISPSDARYIKNAIDQSKTLRQTLIRRIKKGAEIENKQLKYENNILKFKNDTISKQLESKKNQLKEYELKCTNIIDDYKICSLNKEIKKLKTENERLRNGINKRKLKDERKTKHIKDLEKKLKNIKVPKQI